MAYKLIIKELRNSKNMTQEDVSRFLNIPSSTYRNIEKSKYKKFDFDLLFKMKELFNLSYIDDLFRIDD